MNFGSWKTDGQMDLADPRKLRSNLTHPMGTIYCWKRGMSVQLKSGGYVYVCLKRN